MRLLKHLTFFMCYVGLNNFAFSHALKASVIIPGILCSVMLWANYPMTQVYQHEEDARRGDQTFSLLLGIRGTFYFVGIVFGLVTIGFVWYFNSFFELKYSMAFLITLFPVVAYFFYWFIKVYKDESKADFKHTMRLNFISATCLNAFFIYLFLTSTQVLQTF